MGEGRSFLGEMVENSVRLTGVPATARACLPWWAGDRHALESFSPRIRRPSLTAVNWIEVVCILQCAEGRFEGIGGGWRDSRNKIHAAAGKAGGVRRRED